MNGSKNRLELESDNAVNSTDILPIHYQKLFQLCSSFHIASLNTQLTACEQLLRQRDIIDVAIIGRFKAGKSSFLNHIAGRNLISGGCNPCYCGITRLQAGTPDQDGARKRPLT